MAITAHPGGYTPKGGLWFHLSQIRTLVIGEEVANGKKKKVESVAEKGNLRAISVASASSTGFCTEKEEAGRKTEKPRDAISNDASPRRERKTGNSAVRKRLQGGAERPSAPSLLQDKESLSVPPL